MTECGSGPTIEEENAAYERDREERVESYYSGWGAREMAERIVELEDELGSDVDGVCTGKFADVAEAHSEIDRLTSLVGYWEHRAEEEQSHATQFSDLLRYESARADAAIRREDAADAEVEKLREEVARYRAAWLSARRRAADEANMAQEALDFLRDRHEVELRRLRAQLDEKR
ncbi:hypothetical protein ACFQ8W_00305 [Streptomyces sp. NPDC056508]|uniref:hypothetical protein n=1 Tax=Streptomyces sp. NPDC056508 TaxID=3345845 RepID=UPI0036C6A04C